jgi:hypothetical protein
MKAMGLAVYQEDYCCNIAISLIDGDFGCHRLVGHLNIDQNN